MKRVQTQCVLKCRNCLGIFLELSEQKSQKILRVGVILIYLGNFLKNMNRLLQPALAAIQNAQVVPGPGAGGL